MHAKCPDWLLPLRRWPPLTVMLINFPAALMNFAAVSINSACWLITAYCPSGILAARSYRLCLPLTQLAALIRYICHGVPWPKSKPGIWIPRGSKTADMTLAAWASSNRISPDTMRLLLENGYSGLEDIALLDRADVNEMGISPHVQKKLLLKAIEALLHRYSTVFSYRQPQRVIQYMSPSGSPSSNHDHPRGAPRGPHGLRWYQWL